MVMHIPQSSTARASPSDALVSYQWRSLLGGESYPSAVMQSEYSTGLENFSKLNYQSEDIAEISKRVR